MQGQDPGLFQTSANQFANSFANPINPAMLGQGWGMDPSLLTPSYAASFRPHYSGQTPYEAYQRPTWAGGVRTLISPFSPDPVWGNPVDNNKAAVDSVATKPFDSMAWAAQRIALPAVIIGGATKFLGPNTGSIGGDMAGMLMGKGVGGQVGRGVGAGLGRAFGAGMFGRGVTAGLGAVGGFLGSTLLPIAVGQALTSAADELVVQPYVQTRKTARNMMESFAGITYGDAKGNSVSGRGLGAQEAHKMASQVTSAGIKDMTFSSDQFSDIASMGMNSGLFDDTSSKKMVDRVKSVADQVKLIMAISRDPSVKQAIEELSKLHLAGAGMEGGRLSQGASAYREMGIAASVAGTSVQKIMSQVGAQGQYLYQMNGMTPYLGMLASANSYAGFSAAQRSGAISATQLSRMGGLEGAAQSSVAGQVAGAMTPFNRMAMMNEYGFGTKGTSIPGGNQSVTGVLSAFGQNMAADPITNQGAMLLYGKQMAGKFINEKGPAGLFNQADSYLKARGIAPKGSEGRYTSEQMAVGLKAFGLEDDQIIATLHQASSSNSKESRETVNRSVDAQTSEQIRQQISQDGLHGGPVIGTVNAARRFGKRIKADMADFMSPITDLVGSTQDTVNKGVDSLIYGSTIDSNMEGRGITLKDGKYTSDVKGFDKEGFEKRMNPDRTKEWGGSLRRMKSQDQRDSSYVADLLAKASDVNSPNFDSYRTIAKANGSFKSPESRRALYDLLQSSKDDERARDMLERASSDTEGLTGGLSKNLKDSFTKDISTDGKDGYRKVDQALKSAGATSEKSSYGNMRVLGQAQMFTQELAKMGPGADLAAKDLLKKYPELSKAVGGIGSNPVQDAQDLAANALAQGFGGSSQFAATHSVEDYKQDPSMLPPALKAKFLAASKKGPAGEEEMNRIALQAASYSTGGLFGEKLTAAAPTKGPEGERFKEGWDRAAIASTSKLLGEGATAKAQNAAAAIVDTSGMDRATKAFDDSVGLFASSVKILADRLGVQASGKDKATTPQGPSEDTGWAGRFSTWGGVFGRSAAAGGAK